VTLFISNPSRGGAAPSAAGDPVGVKATDPIQVSLRDDSSFVDITDIQVDVGYSRAHALGTGGTFDLQLPRTKLGSIFNPGQFPANTTIATVGSEVQVTKTSGQPGASVYFTSLDRGDALDMSAVFTSVFHVITASTYAPSDPIGPVIGLEHGPRNTAVYCFFTDDGVTKKIRICGPSTLGVRAPDTSVTYDWSTNPENQYVIFWNEAKKQVEVWVDNTAGAGGIGTTTQLAAIPIDQFQPFSGVSVPAGGANDITGIYGVEGSSGTSAGIAGVAVGTDAGFPFINGGRTGGWKTYLDTDISVGFSGTVNPTRQPRGGAWFKATSNLDAAGQIIPSAGGYCRLLKNTPAKNFSIFRSDPGFARTATDGILLEFKCATSTSGGVGFETGAAIQISDGTSLFELDFLFDGATHNIGLLKNGGNPSTPADHFLSTTPIDYTLRTLRLVIDPRRGLIDLFDAADLTTPLVTWPLDRVQLPSAATTQIAVGLPITTTQAVGAFDLYSLKYSYIYQAWEVRDVVLPTGADPAFAQSSSGTAGGPLNEAVMPGVLPLPYTSGGGGGGSGTALLEADGLHIICAGGALLYYTRSAFIDVNRGGVVEVGMKVDAWHELERTGAYVILDDSIKAYMLSFVETAEGRFVCVPLAAGVLQFQEYAGETGPASKLSVAVDWTVFHTYRLERRPRDGVYLYIDNKLALVIPDTARYAFPQTQLSLPAIAFGQFSQEGAETVWKFVRGSFGSGYEISTILDRPESELNKRLNNVRATIVVSAGP